MVGVRISNSSQPIRLIDCLDGIDARYLSVTPRERNAPTRTLHGNAQIGRRCMVWRRRYKRVNDQLD